MEEEARQVLALYGYQEIRTPLMEEASVFGRSLGEAAEIVTKQMYRFEDRAGRTVALRPEGTAPVVRAFIEHGLDKTAGLCRFYYLGPMFRAERPQAGRRRQFHQLGVEVFGSASPYQDVEVICLLCRLLERWRIGGWILKLNSLGCRSDRKKMVKRVQTELEKRRSALCPDCQTRLQKNPLRILDCKEQGCQKQAASLDLWVDVCSDCRRHFQQVTDSLQQLKIPFERDTRLVRGLDYYTRTAFEVIHEGLGAQNALGGGGRYDDLVELMGGTSVPAIGFAVGLERILMVQPQESEREAALARGGAFVATVSAEQIPEAVALVEWLRTQGVAASANFEERPLKRQLEQASKWMPQGCVLILGEDEIRQGVVTVKDLSTGQQRQIPRSALVETVFGRAER